MIINIRVPIKFPVGAEGLEPPNLTDVNRVHKMGYRATL